MENNNICKWQEESRDEEEAQHLYNLMSKCIRADLRRRTFIS